MGRDQHDNAVKLAYQYCGVHLTNNIKPKFIKKAIHTILSDHSFIKMALEMPSTLIKDAPGDTEMTDLENPVFDKLRLEAV